MEEENAKFCESEELTVKVIRQDGKVIIEFENCVREDVVEEIKNSYPEVHDLSSFKNIEY